MIEFKYDHKALEKFKKDQEIKKKVKEEMEGINIMPKMFNILKDAYIWLYSTGGKNEMVKK